MAKALKPATPEGAKEWADYLDGLKTGAKVIPMKRGDMREDQREFHHFIGYCIQKLRGSESRYSFAKRAGVSLSTLVACEKGSMIRLASLELLATAAGMSAGVIFVVASERIREFREHEHLKAMSEHLEAKIAELEKEMITRQKSIITQTYIKAHSCYGMA